MIAKTLGRDEGMNPDAKGGSKVRFIIDGTDGYVSTVETGMDTRAGEAAQVGSIIEVSPPSLRTVDRNIQALATGKDYHGKPRKGIIGNYAIATSGPDVWTDGSGSRGAVHIRAHRLRLATLANAGVVEVVSKDKDGDPYEWRVPEDFEERAISLDMKQGRASGVKLLSVQDLDAQLNSQGSTWLDRSQVSWSKGAIEQISVTQSTLAKELDAAFRQRQSWLMQRGYAQARPDGSVSYQRGYIKALEQEGLNAATQKLEGITGKPFIAAQAGRLIEGTVKQKYELTQGPHALIETQRAFYLVPWESTHAQKWGKRIKGRVLGSGGIDWDTGRTKGIGR